jgi:L-ribulose-5-phosphate 3-epimerase
MLQKPSTAFRIGVRAHDFGKLPAEELAAKIAAKGASCVQLAVTKAIAGVDLVPGRLSPGLAFHIGQAFLRRGIQIAVLGCYINPIHPDPDTRAGLLGFFREHIRVARDFGCGIVALETGSLNADYSPNPENGGDAAFNDLIGSISTLVEEAEKFGVTVGIEGAATHVIGTPRRMRQAVDAIGSGNLQVVFDPVNLLTPDGLGDQAEMISESFELFGDRMAVIHAKDFTLRDGKLAAVPAGRGGLNYGLLMGKLRERKPLISILLEHAGEDAAEECIRFLNGF